jgi:hypothetical protein
MNPVFFGEFSGPQFLRALPPALFTIFYRLFTKSSKFLLGESLDRAPPFSLERPPPCAFAKRGAVSGPCGNSEAFEPIENSRLV